MKTKVLLLSLTTLLSIEQICAQTVQWAVRPTSAQLEGYGQLIKVRKNGKCGLIDHHNQEVVPTKFDSITPFRDGHALVMNIKNKQFKIEGILSEGDLEMQPLTEDVYATQFMWFSDGKMPVVGFGGWGYLNTDGNIAIPCQFQKAYPFSQGYASVMIDDKAYYINRDMDYLPVEAGYGNLLFASSFSGDEAVVYSANSYNPKGYVINRKGRIIRPYKVKPAELKVNKYDHSVGDKTKQMDEQVKQMEIDSRYSVYEDNHLYGYKKNGVIVLPAQLEKAEPVRGEYANVRFKGQNGVLRIIDGGYSAQLENSQIEIRDNYIGKGVLRLSVPAAFEDASIQLKMKNDQGNEMSIQPNINQGNQRLYSISPIEIPRNDTRTTYNLEVWCDNLMLWEKEMNINYVVHKKPVSVTPDAPKPQPDMKIASLSISKPRAKGKKASPQNNFFVTVNVTNKGDARGVATVSLIVDGKPIGNKSVSVRANGSADAVFTISDVRKERYAKVRASLKNGDKIEEASIHFMPFN